MMEYQAVPSGYEISKKVADLLEDIDPIQYNGSNRARRVRNVNDYLQGRNDMPLKLLLEWAAKSDRSVYGDRVAAIFQSIQAFQVQKALLTQKYDKPPSVQQVTYETFDANPRHPLKVIDQKQYDWAAQAGFPTDFFQDSYFDQVTFYCMPDGTSCTDSIFQSCKFNVCRIAQVNFWDCSMYGCEFHSCLIQHTVFPNSFLSYTQFRDCGLQSPALLGTHLRGCNMVDCNAVWLDFMDASLDGCSFGRIRQGNNSIVLHLNTAHITQGGATEEECARNRAAIFKALGIKDPERSPKRRHTPETER